MFFNSWEAIGRTLVVGVLAYIGLIAILKISGKRTLSKMDAFDLVVTVALGSTLSSILINQNVSLLQGIAAYLVLILLQYILAFLSVRSNRIKNLVKSDPELLFYNGEYLRDIMKKKRISEDEIMQSARSSGVGSLDNIHAVVLETDGSFSVIQKTDGTLEDSTLQDVEHVKRMKANI